MKLPSWLPVWALPVGAAGVAAGGLYLIFRPGSASASPGIPNVGSGKCAPWTGDPATMQKLINEALQAASPTGVKPANWDWPALPSYKPGPTSGSIGAMTCRAAEWLVANGRATPEILALVQSPTCGCGKKRAPCGVSGPTAPASVKEAIVAAGVKKGYPAEQVTKALGRESGWRARALNCQGSEPSAGGGKGHPVAGGLNGMLNSVVKSNGFEGTADQFAALTAEEQLPFVISFINRMPKPTCAPRPGEFGLALFTPGFVCKPENTVIYEVGTAGWEQNPGLRSAGGGPVTVGKVLSTG